MKNIFSIFFACCTALAFASDRPIFEDADENETRIYAPIPFAAGEPIFEEDDEDDVTQHDEQDSSEVASTDECGESGCDCFIDDEEEADETVAPSALGLPLTHRGMGDSMDELSRCYSYTSWNRYKSNFGMEKVLIRFPQKPAVSQSSSLFTAYAYDHAVMYSFAGYFPPLGNIDSIRWFDEILFNVSDYPYNLVSHAIFQASNGDWVMDYVVHNYVQNLVIKARAIITPFNGYILQCVKPNGSRDNFNYFLDNFWIRCDCHD